MRNSVKIVVALLAIAAVTLVVLFWHPSKPESVEEVKRVPPSLFAALDSADFMIAYAEGVGDVERKKIVDGRYYRNFVQLLRTDRMQENLQESFRINCKTGLRLALYRDTTFVEEFLFADRIGRKNVPGVWTPRHLGKMNKFLKDIGVQFVECADSARHKIPDEEDVLAPFEKRRPLLTMPKFGGSRKAKKNDEREFVRDSIANLAAEISKPDSSVLGESQNALKILDGIILPADTAWGEPLSVQFKNWKQGEVVFYDASDSADGTKKSVALTKLQMEKLGQLLSRTRLETFSMGQEWNFNHYAKIVLYNGNNQKNGELELWNGKLELWSVDENARFLVKRRVGCRAASFKGYWLPEKAAVLKAFLELVKSSGGD